MLQELKNAEPTNFQSLKYILKAYCIQDIMESSCAAASTVSVFPVERDRQGGQTTLKYRSWYKITEYRSKISNTEILPIGL